MNELTIESIIEAKRLIGNKPVLVGIVCSPAFMRVIKREAKINNPPPVIGYLGNGVDFYIDCDQTENFKPFYDHKELRDYLSRNEPPLTQTENEH